jgi:hypothetical protein
MKSISSICNPALLYLVLSIITFILLINKLSAVSLGLKAIFVIMWTWILNYLCSIGFSTISWILVLLPIIMILMMYNFALDTSSK